jgi:cytochrome bd-type quinol oxidase subunit 1
MNFVFGVVTGIPMEFEVGTNWARFSRLSGGVIGQPLAMEGVFSFFDDVPVVLINGFYLCRSSGSRSMSTSRHLNQPHPRVESESV